VATRVAILIDGEPVWSWRSRVEVLLFFLIAADVLQWLNDAFVLVGWLRPLAPTKLLSSAMLIAMWMGVYAVVRCRNRHRDLQKHSF